MPSDEKAEPKKAPHVKPDAKKTYRLPDGRVVDFSAYADWLTGNLVESINSEPKE